MSETSTRKVRPIEAAGRRDGDLDGLAARPIATVYADLETRASGLTGREAAARLKRFGENRIDTAGRRHLVAAVIDRLRNPLVLILFAAAGVSAFTGDVPSFVIITVIVSMSIALDVVQEHRAENAAEALRAQVSLSADVLRDGAFRAVDRKSTRLNSSHSSVSRMPSSA